MENALERLDLYDGTCLIVALSGQSTKMVEEFDKLLTPLILLCRNVVERRGATIVIMPKECTVWSSLGVGALMDEFHMRIADVDCCALGIDAEKGRRAGLPIMRPLRVAANSPQLLQVLEPTKCPGADQHPVFGKNCCHSLDDGRWGTRTTCGDYPLSLPEVVRLD